VKARAFTGAARDVAARLSKLAAELQVDEMAITTATYDTAARVKSYELLAREFGLGNAELAKAS